MEIFTDNDTGYFEWLTKHPDGFVMNTNRKPSASYLMLHMASCDHISDRSVSNYTKDYSKVCSERKYELITWAREQLEEAPSSCYSCAP